MIVKENSKAYSSKRTLVQGQGFVDIAKGIVSYIAQNKDLIAKPMLRAVGNIGALGMTEVSKALIKKTAAEKIPAKKQLDPESMQILERLKIGRGIKQF